MASLDLDRAVTTAEASFERGDFSSALSAYRAILVSRLNEPAGAATAFDAAVIERVADLATLFGQYSAAEDLLIALAGRFRSAGGSIGADHALLKLCSVRFAREHLTHARHALEQLSFVDGDLDNCLALAPDLDRWERRVAPGATADDRALLCSRFYLECSKLLAAHGLYQRAFAAAQRGLDLCSQNASEVVCHAVPALTLAAAAASLERGDIANTDRLLADVGRDVRWQHPAWTVRRLEILAKARLLSGDFGAAKAGLDEVLATCAKGGFDAAAAQAAVNLAQALILINQTKAATDVLAAAERRATAAQAESVATRAARLKQVAELRAMSLADGVAIAPSVSELWLGPQSGMTAAATTERDPPEMPQAMNFLTLFEDRALVFHWHLGRRDWAAARTCLDDLSNTVAHTDSMLIVARLLAMESMLLYYTTDYAMACDGFSEAVQVLGDLGLLADRWQAQRFLGWTLKRLNRPEEAARIVEQADHTLDRITTTLTGEDQAIFRLNKWTADEEFLGARLASIGELTQTAARLPWWRRFFLERRRRREVALFLSQIDRHQRITFGRAVHADSVPGSDTWHAEPIALRTARDTAVLGFLVLPDRLVVARLCRGRADVSVRPLTRLQLRQLVSDWHTSLVSGEPSHVAAERMSQLKTALGFEALLEGLPAGVRHLRIVTDDSLRGVPFSAFDFRGQPVIVHYSVTTAFGWSPDAVMRTGQSAGLAVGVVEAHGDFRPLENARPEIAMVGRWLARHRIAATRLEDDQATCPAVIERLPGATHLHVASHGVFSRDHPDRSGLVMSGGKDDVLTLRDLAALDLASLRLAVLSACWAADNFILPGRVVLSLPYTLWRAGARTVLAPLWEIDDAVALAFMTRFYDCLESMSPREALQHVQRECLQGTLPGCAGTDVADPIHWAGFQLFGDGAGDLAG